MSHPMRSALRARTSATLVAGLVAVTTATTLSSIPAATAADSACPEPVPVADVTRGMPVHGLTVSSGNTTDAFTGEVVGVLEDGVSVGLDMIMVELEGSVITKPGDPSDPAEVDRGIWAGMSGSPVYAEDGRLIGAVAYGLSYEPSNIAGVTPAADMYSLGRYENVQMPAAATPATVETTPLATHRLMRAGVPTAQARQGFRRLAMPLSVSGLTPDRLQRAANRVDLPRRVVATGRARTAATTADIFPGSNVAMAMSYGDISSSGVGTTTAVCEGKVLAFGHPFFFAGKANASLHAADAVYVQRDAAFGSFKVANLSTPVGTFTQDRLAGILGTLGTVPQATPVTSTVTSTGYSRTGVTQVTDPAWTADMATFHLFANLDRAFDGYQPGTGRLEWSATLRRENGQRVTVTRSDLYSSAYDLTMSMPWDFYLALSRLMSNKFEDVEIVDVTQKARLSTAFRQVRIATVKVARDGRWRTVGRRSVVPVRAGKDLRIKVSLEPAADSEAVPREAYLRLRVPRRAREGFAFVSVAGGLSHRFGGESAGSFGELVRQLSNGPGNTSVVATLRSRGRGAATVEKYVEKAAPVSGSQWFAVAVR